MATLYNAHPETKRYLPGRETTARKNPFYNADTHAEADRYLYNPRTSSLEPPRATGNNEGAFLVDGQWVKKTDRTGQYYYAPDGTRVDITAPGIDVPDGCLREDPPGQYYTTHDGAAWIFDTAAARADIKAAIHNEKKRVRDSGVTVDGILFDTDLMARVSYREFADQAALDPAYTVPDWRASRGVFVTMDAALHARVAEAGKQLFTHVFAWQRQQEAKVDAATGPEALSRINTRFQE